MKTRPQHNLDTNGLYLILLSVFCLVSLAIPVNAGQQVEKASGEVGMTDVVRAKFGSGPDDIGILTPQEANPEGPMSFAIGEDGDIYILDQVNSRIQCFKKGKRLKTISIPSNTFMDIALTQDGKIALLDNLVKKSVYILDSEGKTLNIIPLEGRLIPYAPEVTEIMYVKKGEFSGIWAIVGDRSVRIAMPDGTTDTNRISVPGTFSWDGRRLFKVEKLGDATAVIYRSEQDSLSKWEPEITVSFNMYIVHLLGIWDDSSGRIYLGATLEDRNNKHFNTIAILTHEGKELRRVNLFVQKMPHEIYRSVRVSHEGYIFQMGLDRKGVFVKRYKLDM